MQLRTVVILLLAAACGDDSAAKSDAKTADAPIDMPTIDAPALPPCAAVSGTTVTVRQVTQIGGEGGALLVTSPPNDGRLFVVMQTGKVMIVENEQLRPTPFLDISSSNLAADAPPAEQGLLGLAFAPNYAATRELYVMYTTSDADIVARFHADPTDPYKVESNTAEIILSIDDFASNHNGGMIEFGKDGYLYISTGDGGNAGDPRHNSQSIDRASCEIYACEPLLGKILRIDVSTTSGVKNYAIPPTNPFAAGGGEPEIFVVGLRNPWRWSFDRVTSDMWIADVGQFGYEEIDVLRAGEIAGKNLGWSMWEGRGTAVTDPECYGNYPCTLAGMTMPQIELSHDSGWAAVIGGEVYRGTCYPDIVGTYFFTDYNRHILDAATLNGDGTATTADLPSPEGGWPQNPASIHSDARGELYLTTASSISSLNGLVYHIEAGP